MSISLGWVLTVVSAPMGWVVIFIALTAAACLLLGFWVALPRWSRKGSSQEHFVIIVEGQEYWFTPEELKRALVRAQQLAGRFP